MIYLLHNKIYYMDFRIWYRNSYWLLFMSINQYGSEIKKGTFTSENILRKNSGSPEITKNSSGNPEITKINSKNPVFRPPLPFPHNGLEITAGHFMTGPILQMTGQKYFSN